MRTTVLRTVAIAFAVVLVLLIIMVRQKRILRMKNRNLFDSNLSEMNEDRLPDVSEEDYPDRTDKAITVETDSTPSERNPEGSGTRIHVCVRRRR